MAFKVEITPSCLKDLDRLDKQIRQSVFEKLNWLSKNFEVKNALPLHYKWKGYFKIRIGG